MRHEWIALPGVSLALLLAGTAAGSAVPLLPACDGERMPPKTRTCIATADRGWDDRSRWRLEDIKGPEISSRTARCRAEQQAGVRARDRMRVLMSTGYTLTFTGRTDPSGWPLARMRLADGRDASAQLMSEGIVQAAPRTANRWCGPKAW